jgi:hypothetical protein
MAEHTERSAAPNLLAIPDMAEMGKKRIENFADAQGEPLNQIQETNRQWFGRMQSEAEVASFPDNKKLSAPDDSFSTAVTDKHSSDLEPRLSITHDDVYRMLGHFADLERRARPLPSLLCPVASQAASP